MRIPVCSADVPEKFNKVAKYLARHWPGGPIWFSDARERLAFLMGYPSSYAVGREVVAEATIRSLAWEPILDAVADSGALKWSLDRKAFHSLLKKTPWHELRAGDRARHIAPVTVASEDEWSYEYIVRSKDAVYSHTLDYYAAIKRGQEQEPADPEKQYHPLQAYIKVMKDDDHAIPSYLRFHPAHDKEGRYLGVLIWHRDLNGYFPRLYADTEDAVGGVVQHLLRERVEHGAVPWSKVALSPIGLSDGFLDGERRDVEPEVAFRGEEPLHRFEYGQEFVRLRPLDALRYYDVPLLSWVTEWQEPELFDGVPESLLSADLRRNFSVIRTTVSRLWKTTVQDLSIEKDGLKVVAQAFAQLLDILAVPEVADDDRLESELVVDELLEEDMDWTQAWMTAIAVREVPALRRLPKSKLMEYAGYAGSAEIQLHTDRQVMDVEEFEHASDGWSIEMPLLYVANLVVGVCQGFRDERLDPNVRKEIIGFPSDYEVVVGLAILVSVLKGVRTARELRECAERAEVLFHRFDDMSDMMGFMFAYHRSEEATPVEWISAHGTAKSGGQYELNKALDPPYAGLHARLESLHELVIRKYRSEIQADIDQDEGVQLKTAPVQDEEVWP